MNLVVDRDRVAQIFGGDRAVRPTCQQLPPNFPGYEPYCPYSNPGPEERGLWGAPGVEKPERIVRRSGTGDMRVVFEMSPVPGSFAQEGLWGSTWSICSERSDTAGP